MSRILLSRFCNLCGAQYTDNSFRNISRRYKRAASSVEQKKKESYKIHEAEKRETGEPIITCKNGSLNFYKHQDYPKKGHVPLASGGWNHFKAKGDHFFIHPTEPIKEEAAEEEVDQDNTFQDLNLDESICQALEGLDMRIPLEVQKLGIPKILDGCNVILAAQTGCGKTLCYLLPMVQRILRWKQMIHRGYNNPLAIIVTPTRELAVQIGLETIKLSNRLGIRTKIITGGKTRRMMMNPPVGNVDVIVGSFGVISKLTTNKIYKLDFVRYLVLDEADALFHPTFEEKLQIFVKKIPIGYLQDEKDDDLPNVAQLVLSSATIPSRISEVLGSIVDVNSLEYIVTRRLHQILVLQKFIRLGPSQKPAELLKYIKPKVSAKQSVIIFSNENATCDWISIFLNGSGVKCTHLNGDMPLSVRRGKYGEFLNGKSYVLSTTNAASRGLDTLMVNHILNYEFPLDTADYIHRCGRTGRIGTIGECRVTNFISTPSEIDLVKKIERAVRRKKPLPIINTLNPEEEEEVPKEIDRTFENVDEKNAIPY